MPLGRTDTGGLPCIPTTPQHTTPRHVRGCRNLPLLHLHHKGCDELSKLKKRTHAMHQHVGRPGPPHLLRTAPTTSSATMMLEPHAHGLAHRMHLLASRHEDWHPSRSTTKGFTSKLMRQTCDICCCCRAPAQTLYRVVAHKKPLRSSATTTTSWLEAARGMQQHAGSQPVHTIHARGACKQTQHDAPASCRQLASMRQSMHTCSRGVCSYARLCNYWKPVAVRLMNNAESS